MRARTHVHNNVVAPAAPRAVQSLTSKELAEKIDTKGRRKKFASLPKKRKLVKLIKREKITAWRRHDGHYIIHGRFVMGKNKIVNMRDPSLGKLCDFFCHKKRKRDEDEA